MRNKRSSMRGSVLTPTGGKSRGGQYKGQESVINIDKKTLSKMNREISSMKAKLRVVEKGKEVSFEDEDSDFHDNAGDQFGGRKKNKQKRAEQQE